MADTTSQLDAIFGPGWQQRVAGGQPLVANGYQLVPNMTQNSADYSGSEYMPGLALTPENYTLFQGNGTGTNYLFDKTGKGIGKYEGSDQGLMKGVGQTLKEGLPLILGAMAGFGAIGGMTGAAGAAGAGAMSGMDMAADTAGFGGSWMPSAGMDLAADVPSGYLSGDGYIPGSSITTASYEAPTGVGGYSTNYAPGSLGSGTYGLDVPGMGDVATGGTLGSGTYGVSGMTGGASGAGIGAGTNWLSATGAGLGDAGGAAGGSSLLDSLGGGSLKDYAMKYGVPLVNGLVNSNAAKNAAGKVTDATNAANAGLLAQYQQTRADLTPWREGGAAANNALMQKLGVGGNPGAGDFGELNKNFTGADLASEPGYQFGLQQGQQAIDRRTQSAGNYFSGGALKAASRFGTDYAGTKYGDAYSRDAQNKQRTYNFLSGSSGLGENAAAQTGNFGSTMANNVANNTTALGNAQGAAGIAGTNALTGALGGIAANYTQNELLDRVMQNSQNSSNALLARITGGNAAWG